jgi:hypothetical protein
MYFKFQRHLSLFIIITVFTSASVFAKNYDSILNTPRTGLEIVIFQIFVVIGKLDLKYIIIFITHESEFHNRPPVLPCDTSQPDDANGSFVFLNVHSV